MAHNDPMTWRPKDRRWTKYFNKKHYYVSHRQLVKAGLLKSDAPNTKDGTRVAMKAWWKQTEAKLKAEVEAAREPQQPEGVYLSGVGMDFDDAGAPAGNRIRLRVKQQVTDPDGVLSEHIGKLIAEGQQQAARLQTGPPAEQTIGPNVADFLAFKRGSECSIDRVDCLRIHLAHFMAWFSDQPVTNVNEDTLDGYYQHVLGEARKGTYSRTYARDLFASFKQFARWLASRRRIAMPYNLSSREFGFKLRSKIKTFSDEEIELLLGTATEKTKLYILLMLNTGATQIDIAELSKSNIDFDRGELTRKRYKTEDHDHVPVVLFPLWPETLRLLKIHLNTDETVVNRHNEPLALIGESGKPLLVKNHNAKGQLTKKDAIRSAFNRVIRKLRDNGTPVDGSLKHLRKTAATKLESHPSYGRYVVHFLGQSAKTIAGKHYVTPSQEQFAAAVMWLGRQWLDPKKIG